MKHPSRRPTRKQKIFIKSRLPRLNIDNWLVMEDTEKRLILENKFTGSLKVIPK